MAGQAELMLPEERVEDFPIRVRGLRNVFGTHLVHDNLDLDVRRGEILGVVGGSGTGKSVLMRSIIGLQLVDAGSIEVLGQSITDARDDADIAIRCRWGVLFQGGALFSTLTVAENVEVPLREFYPDISQQLLAEIARYKVLLTGLSADLILGLQQTLGLTVFLITHDLDTLHEICDRVAVLADKHVIAVGTIPELIALDHPWIQEYFKGPRGRAALASRSSENASVGATEDASGKVAGGKGG
eukprot:gene15927-16093_t